MGIGKGRPADAPAVIAIAGAPGSGKSSVAALLRGMLPGYGYFSAGQAFRRIAAERGLTVNELTALADRDPSVDRLVDAMLMEFGQQAGRAIIDSRMAWHFLPESFKVYLDVDLKTAAERIHICRNRGATERYVSLDEAMDAVARRGRSERSRYRALYGVDILDPANYDLVLDTSAMTAAGAAAQVLAAYRARRPS